MGGVLAIDFGEKKSGFASVDALRIAPQPLEAQRLDGRSVELLDHIFTLVSERSVDTLLVGLPLHADGSAGERARASRDFADSLRKRFPGFDVRLYDEHLTTKEAERRLREAGHRGRDASRRRDSWSALVLLEDWIASGEPASAPWPDDGNAPAGG